MLSGQIGISIENALLYENLEAKVIERTKEIEKTLTELKSTQAQLIQAEKMASLGELTAGIAHEIQNPLNFVNNFSEINGELIDEVFFAPIYFWDWAGYVVSSEFFSFPKMRFD